MTRSHLGLLNLCCLLAASGESCTVFESPSNPAPAESLCKMKDSRREKRKEGIQEIKMPSLSLVPIVVTNSCDLGT